MKRGTIKLFAWLAAIIVVGSFTLVYINLNGLDGGFQRYLVKGNEAYAEGKYQKAADYYIQMIEVSPGNPTGYIEAANAYTALGQYQTAIDLLRAYVDTKPRSAEAYEKLLSLYEKVGNSLQEQIEVLRSAANVLGNSTYADRAAELEKNLEAVPAPKVSPASGTYSGVQLVMVTNLESGETVYYTTDGTTPSISSTRYAESTGISIGRGETELKIVKYGVNRNRSPIATFKYTVE